nr:rust resistance kinase Lr10-like isoform X1 [Ipomoea batatas]
MVATAKSEPLVIACLISILVIQFSWLSNSQCNPSSCGSIHNITNPFRLNTDPQDCGHPDYELTCEQNRTVLTLNSQKYYVQSINYDNYTIRVVDPGVQQNNMCSFPQYALGRYSFGGGSNTYDINLFQNRTFLEITVPIVFFSCPFPMKNSSAFVEITANDCSNRTSDGNAPFFSSGGFVYAKLGPFIASDLRVSCRVDLITQTSWQIQENGAQNVSLLDIHDAMMYGFELSWFQAVLCEPCGKEKCEVGALNVVTCVPDIPSGMAFHLLKGVGILIAVAAVFGGISILLRIIIGIPCAIVFLIIKLQRRHLSVFDAIENFLNAENNLSPIRTNYGNGSIFEFHTRFL